MNKNFFKLLPILLTPIALSACNYTDAQLDQELNNISISPVVASVKSDVLLEDFASDKYLNIDGLSINNKIAIKKIQKIDEENLLLTFVIVNKKTKRISKNKSVLLKIKYID
ncbi:hypothetical protein EG856_00660 [Mycoplasmopsis phocirhinis]|uniref:Lipoprotein n=1 Tax=Mycoplasmopsis phocirhinis TaxID=142650 RepID=A0A4P6MN84_9BACT|nr:hypothetical protein [Mycoplasmopsis phocirhinis]QBF34443.1 hypothetical protein EG856_00660 [Mycoplasmopsis phocirhinis]